MTDAALECPTALEQTVDCAEIFLKLVVER